MEVKYKIHELAKDLNLKSTVLIDMLKNYSDAVRKSQTTLTPEELDYVFDTVTTSHAVENFDAFFAMEKPAQPEPEAVETPVETQTAAETTAEAGSAAAKPAPAAQKAPAAAQGKPAAGKPTAGKPT
ncbi:MAG: translation initiation factor IF-2, partial [Clostridia bacterium]|nr:translation initiation factor IF-2 [Clostridia bacterium]